MADEEKNDDEASIFKVDTVPPPDGDGDAYNAPTKVGPVSSEAWVELMRKADAEGERSAEAVRQLAESGPSSKSPKSLPKPSVDGAPSSKPSSKPQAGATPAVAAAPAVAIEDIPKVYNEDSDEANMATLLHPRAKEVHDSGARADANVFGVAPVVAAAPEAEAPPPTSILDEQQSGARTTFMFAVALCIAVFVAGLIYYYLRTAS